MKFEFSFDDGHISDVRAAKLLHKYGLKGTFYNTNRSLQGIIKMSPVEIARGILPLGHEMGGHTISHPPDIKLLSDEQLRFELENSKYGTEMVFRSSLQGKPITKFAYPRGRHDERVRAAVKEAGYLEARTTRVLQIRNDKNDPFQTPTTIQIHPARKEYNGEQWYQVAERMLLMAIETSRFEPDIFFSVWGHTHEMDHFGLWNDFEKLLSTISPLQNKV